jgi:hypothetical protein
MTHCYRFLLLKHREDKTHKKTIKKKPREGRELTFKLPMCPLTFAFLLLHFRFKRFFLASSSSQIKEKKNHREEKKCKEGRELTFNLSFCPLIFGSYFYPLASARSFQAFFLGIFFSSNIRKKKTQRKKNHRRKKM